MNGWTPLAIAVALMTTVAGISFTAASNALDRHALQPHVGAVSRLEYSEGVKAIQEDIREIRRLLEKRAKVGG